MEQELLNSAVKTMLQKTNTKQSLTTYSKEEPKPSFVTAELLSYYESTDLSLTWVYECCKILKVLKSVDINDMQIEFWYKEFLRMGWKKKDFDRQYEAIKRATLYNRIDFENWIKTELMYNEIDLNVELDRRINNLIRKGESLKNNTDLTEEEKKYVQVAAAKDLEFKHSQRRYEIMEEAKNEVKRQITETLTAKKQQITNMTLKQKMDILDAAINRGAIKAEKNGFEYGAILHNLVDYADLLELSGK